MISVVDERPARASTARRHLARRYAAAGHPAPEYAAALVVARGERGATVDELAGALGVDRPVLAGLEAGEIAPAQAPAGVRRFLASLPDRAARAAGSLLAGATGDALGAAAEFWSIGEIRARLGPAGVTGPVAAYGRPFPVTDDTQLSLFTAEGLLRAWPGDDPLPSIAAAYRRWLATQERSLRPADGWLMSHPFLHARRAPGTTCLAALRTGAPVATSKGCGGVMRVAPVGLWGLDVPAAFDLGSRAAALTHAHPSGHLSAGVLAALVTQLAGGTPLPDALAPARDELVRHPGHEETAAAFDAAVDAWRAGEPLTPESVERLGGGWVGEEALAIGLFCALAAGDVRAGLLAAVNHSGDSDSTASICGNLLGAELGADLVPPAWVDALEGHEVIAAVAGDLADRGRSHPERWPVG